MSKVLIADDERSICQAFAQFLRLEGHTPLIASNGREALELLRREQPDAVFLDVRMPGMDGLEVLAQIRAERPELPVIVMTAYGTMDTAMAAMRQGAFDYLGKPVELPQLRTLLQRALHRPQVGSEEAVAQPEQTLLVGQSSAMQEIYKLMGLLTQNDLTVLVTGESGVGKELVARGIHLHSHRRDLPFVAVNCAAIPEQLLESELFGHEKGAFTGADSRRLGRCEAAGEGTLFLDEISELPLHLQSKLLRVLQERSFERVGSVTPLPLKARVIAASNRHLETEVEQGRFREDLYHRLKLVTLHIPPLRKRTDDIEALVYHFLRRANAELSKQVQSIEPEVLERLRQYHWPGNVRELEHTIKRSVLLAHGSLLTVHDLDLKPAAPAAPVSALNQLQAAARVALQQLLSDPQSAEAEQGIFHTLVDITERELIDEALRLTQGNQVAASRLLGLHRTTMRNKIQRVQED